MRFTSWIGYVLLALVTSSVITVTLGVAEEADRTKEKDEEVLPADKAPVSAPLRRAENLPWFQLSNLRKGGGAPRPAEFRFDYVRDIAGLHGASIVLIANGAKGRKEYSSWGPFSPFNDTSGTVAAEASFSPLAKRLGDQFEVWLEAHVKFENKSYAFKISNTVILGEAGQPTRARQWTAEEQTGIERWQKSITPPPAPPAGHVAVTPQTKLIPGMPILAGWISEWVPAEIISVQKSGAVLVKYQPEHSQSLVLRNRDWLAAESNVLQAAESDPSKFRPSVAVLPDGTLPLTEILVPLDDVSVLVKGVPLRMAFGNKWVAVTVVKVLVDGRVRIHRDEWKKHPAEDKPRDALAIERDTLALLQQPEAADKFAANAAKLDAILATNEAESKKPGNAPRKNQQKRLQNNPIKIAIPETAIRVTDEMPLQEGTKLRCSWGGKWHDVTIIEVHDDKTVRIHWDKFGDAWDGDIARDSLIIEKDVAEKLPKAEAKPSAKNE